MPRSPLEWRNIWNSYMDSPRLTWEISFIFLPIYLFLCLFFSLPFYLSFSHVSLNKKYVTLFGPNVRTNWSFLFFPISCRTPYWPLYLTLDTSWLLWPAVYWSITYASRESYRLPRQENWSFTRVSWYYFDGIKTNFVDRIKITIKQRGDSIDLEYFVFLSFFSL